MASTSLKGYLPAVSFVMAKKGKATQATRQELPTPAPTQNPDSTPTTQTVLKSSFLFLESSPQLSGASSALLEKMIEAMGVKRELAQVSNLKSHEDAGKGFGTQIVIALGEATAQAILRTDLTLAKLRGKVHFLKTGERMIVTYHPAFLLDNPAAKKEAWEDLKLAMRELSAP